MINAILVTVYTSIAKRKLETYEENEENFNKSISKFESERSEAKGKMSVLKEVKLNITKSVTYKSQIHQGEEGLLSMIKRGVKKVIGEDGKERHYNEKGEEITETPVSNEEFERQKNQIVEDSYAVIEEMKNLENEHEENFQGYLKKLGEVMLNPKKLKTFDFNSAA